MISLCKFKNIASLYRDEIFQTLIHETKVHIKKYTIFITYFKISTKLVSNRKKMLILLTKSVLQTIYTINKIYRRQEILECCANNLPQNRSAGLFNWVKNVTRQKQKKNYSNGCIKGLVKSFIEVNRNQIELNCQRKKEEKTKTVFNTRHDKHAGEHSYIRIQ